MSKVQLFSDKVLSRPLLFSPKYRKQGLSQFKASVRSIDKAIAHDALKTAVVLSLESAKIAAAKATGIPWAMVKPLGDVAELPFELALVDLSAKLKIRQTLARAKKTLQQLPQEKAEYFIKKTNDKITALFVKKYNEGDFSNNLNTLHFVTNLSKNNPKPIRSKVAKT